MHRSPPTPPWLFYTLFAAGVYNILWGAYVVLLPEFSFVVLGAVPPKYPELWQCIGMIVGVYGLGYIVAAADPYRHWPIILVGFLGKVFGPIGFAKALMDGTFPLSFGINIIFNDLIWWFPFGYSLLQTYRWHSQNLVAVKNDAFAMGYRLANGDTFGDRKGRHLVVALRHHGCTFTKEALSDLSQALDSASDQTPTINLLHMDASGEFSSFAEKYMASHPWNEISDPDQNLYRAFGFGRAKMTQAFGFKEWVRGMEGFFKGYRVGPLRGDGFQLAGLVLIDDGNVIKAFHTKRASDKLPFQEFL